jgi:hypothetical protein
MLSGIYNYNLCIFMHTFPSIIYMACVLILFRNYQTTSQQVRIRFFRLINGYLATIYGCEYAGRMMPKGGQ